MNRPLHRCSLLATSVLSITALGIGLASPATAHPAVGGPDPATAAAVSELLADPDLLSPISGLSDEALERIAERQASAAKVAASTNSTTALAEEVARSETSVTYRFTLPPGEVTRDSAVLQGFYETAGMRVSQISYLTDPASGVGTLGADYDQQLVDLEVANLLRENFTVVGATPTSLITQDHFSVPAGQNVFEITINSARSQEQFRDAYRAITGTQPPAHGADPAEYATTVIFGTRMELPANITWAYGDRLSVYRGVIAPPMYPDGAGELTATSSNQGMYPSTLTVRRTDGQPFSGNRVIALDPAVMNEALYPELNGVSFFELVQELMPPPLRPGTLTTVVTGATLVRDGFYLPNPGVTTLRAETTGTGPRNRDEAEGHYTDWVTNTCNASLTDEIPGFPVEEGSQPVTWQSYFDEQFQTPENGEPPADHDEDTDPPVYTGPEYIDAVYNEARERSAFIDDLLPDGMTWEELFRAYEDLGAFWDEACGTSDGPGDGQTPASLSLSVPTTGVAGSPLTLSASVTDSAGNPVVGRQVTFTITEGGAGTLQMAATGARLTPEAAGTTTLTAISGSNGVASVEFTPTASGTLRISASTGGADPVTSDSDSTITVTPAPGGGGDTPSSSGSLGSIFGSVGS